MRQMNLGFSKSNKYTLEHEISLAKELIDKSRKGLVNEKLYIEEGFGRTVILLDNIVIKDPIELENLEGGGCVQNLKELEVWLSTKHKHLNPIYTTHKGALICKRLDNDPYISCSRHSIEPYEVDEIIERKVYELQDIIDKFGLSIEDLKKPSSWGFDYEDGELKCLDYGYHSEIPVGRYNIK